MCHFHPLLIELIWILIVGSSVVNLSENEPLWATKEPEIVVASCAELLIRVLPSSASAVVILLASELLGAVKDPLISVDICADELIAPTHEPEIAVAS